HGHRDLHTFPTRRSSDLAVGAGVLRDHQNLLDAGLDQPLGFAEHIAHWAADQLAAHGRDNAEAAAVVAAFGNLQVGIVARGELEDRKSTRLNSSHVKISY